MTQSVSVFTFLVLSYPSNCWQLMFRTVSALELGDLPRRSPPLVPRPRHLELT